MVVEVVDQQNQNENHVVQHQVRAVVRRVAVERQNLEIPSAASSIGGHHNLTLLSRNPICRPDASLTFESRYRVSLEDHHRPHSLSNLSQTIDIRSPSSIVRGKRTPRQNLNQGQKGHHKEVNIWKFAEAKIMMHLCLRPYPLKSTIWVQLKV